MFSVSKFCLPAAMRVGTRGPLQAELTYLLSDSLQQTNTSDMLDLAVDYIKDLQKQVKVRASQPTNSGFLQNPNPNDAIDEHYGGRQTCRRRQPFGLVARSASDVQITKTDRISHDTMFFSHNKTASQKRSSEQVLILPRG